MTFRGINFQFHQLQITSFKSLYKMNWKRIIKYTFWIALLGAGIFWSYDTLKNNKAQLEANAKRSETRNAIIPVKTAKVANMQWGGSFEVVGNFAPYKQVALMSEMAGKIVSINIENGSYVKAGQRLLSTDNELLKIQKETLGTNLAKAENDLKRLKNLLGEGGVTQQQIDDTELAIANVKAEIKSVDKQISMTNVNAPISGIISNKMVEKGSLVAPGNPIATITNVNKLKMQAMLTEEQIITVKKGDKISISSDLFPDKKINGKVTFIDVNAGPSRRYMVEVEIPNSKNELKAGMTSTAFFPGGKELTVMSIPREAIVGDIQNGEVYVVSGENAKLKKIEIGLNNGRNIQVKSGLEIGEEVIISGQINLEDGKQINISN